MADTIPNIIIAPDTITDIYADAGVIAGGLTVGTKLNIAMLGQGNALLYSGAVAPPVIGQESGYRELLSNEELVNDTGDSGAFIYSRLGCTINVQGG